MNYEKEYNKLVGKIKKAHLYAQTDSTRAVLEDIYPQLAGSEDERIRKELIETINCMKEDHQVFLSEQQIERYLAYLEKQKENPKFADSIPSDCVSYAKCEDRWHKVTDSLPDNGRLVLAQDCLGNILLARYDGEGNWEVSVYDNNDYYCRNTITKWCEIPSEKQKEQKPIIQDVELNDAVYDYVRDHFIAGADFTPEYIKKLMENAFFAGVDYYLLKQESESCEPDTNVEKVIEDVIRVYGKTQGEWVGGYDVDTLIVNLRRAFNKKEQKPADLTDMMVHKEPCIAPVPTPMVADEQKPAEWNEEDEKDMAHIIRILNDCYAYGKHDLSKTDHENLVNKLKSLRPSWKPSEVCYGPKGDPDPAGTSDLEEAAEEYASKTLCDPDDGPTVGLAKEAFIAGAEWQKKHLRVVLTSEEIIMPYATKIQSEY